MASCVPGELIPCAFVWHDPGITPCCRSRRRERAVVGAEARALACHSPVRAVAGDYSNDCQRDFGDDLTLTLSMRPRAEAAVPQAWPTCGGSERLLPA